MFRPRVTWPGRVSAMVAFVIVLAGCTAGDDAGDRASGDQPTSQLTADQGAAALLAELGPPDVFVVEAEPLEGDQLGRRESWTYTRANTQVDLFDGVILWRTPIDPVSDGTLLPAMYDPTEFELGMSLDDLRALLTPVELTEVGPLDDLGYDGVTLHAGPQLLVGFAQDQLVYAETFPLAQEDAA